MGKRGRGRGRGRGAGSSSTSNGRHDQRGQRGDYDTIITRNDDFESYYRSQQIISDEEWEEFIQKCIDPLPLTFRITASRAASAAVNEHVEKFFVPYLSNVEYEGVKQSPPKPLQWYPNHLAWQLDVSKHVVRKTQEFSKFQQFLVHETDAGNVSRQEAVSMIPPLLLDVQPHHFVLDCCAAPGSKTTQLLEALHAQSPDASNPHAASMPAGLLVANDSDAKRCHMLVHQSLNRIGSPNTMVTNLDATAIPNIRITHQASGQPRTLLFDRILCDVPCSGDGTMRKNPNIWKTWKPADGLGLHGLQLRILTRALQMLKPGGRVCYSTCSFNPIENEAVVSAALEAHPDLSLVDVKDRLPGLHRRSGLTKWTVYDKYLNRLASPADFKADYRSDPKAKAPAATCWPNGKEEERNLHRCLRLYPHLQNTGGFFVALLEKAAKPERSVNGSKVAVPPDSAETGSGNPSASAKRSPSPVTDTPAVKRLKEDATTGEAQSDSDSTSGPVGQAKATEGGGRPFNEEPYAFLSPTDEQVKICLDFFDLSSDFPSENLFVRNTSGQALRSIYLTSPVIRNVISLNDYGKMRLVSCGVKILTRQDSGATGVYPCRWRILQDGLTLLTEYMSDKRKVKANLNSLRAMMVEPYPHFDKIEEEEFRKQIDTLEPGSCICEFTAGGEAGGRLESSIVVPLWKAPNSLCLMVEKLEKKALSMRIFGEDLTGHNQPKSKGDKAKPADPESKPVDSDEVAASTAAADPVQELVAKEELGQDA